MWSTRSSHRRALVIAGATTGARMAFGEVRNGGFPPRRRCCRRVARVDVVSLIDEIGNVRMGVTMLACFRSGRRVAAMQTIRLAHKDRAQADPGTFLKLIVVVRANLGELARPIRLPLLRFRPESCSAHSPAARSSWRPRTPKTA